MPWPPKIGRMNVERGAVTYIDTFMRDTDLARAKELRAAMMIDRGRLQKESCIIASGNSTEGEVEIH